MGEMNLLEKAKKYLESVEIRGKMEEYNDLKSYIETLKMQIAYYSSLNIEEICKDRLSCYKHIVEFLNVINHSLKGWYQWIKTISLMNEFSLDDLKNIAFNLRNTLLQLLKTDYQATYKRLEILENYLKGKNIVPEYQFIQTI